MRNAHKDWYVNQMRRQQDNLLAFVRATGPRPDWHEPDEQDITAIVHGDHLDNAFGTDITGAHGFQEYVVELRSGEMRLRINLANLFADYVRLIRAQRGDAP